MSSSNHCLSMTQGLNYKMSPFVPTIAVMPNQKVVTVNMQGDPNTETAKVLPSLYVTAYAIRKDFKEKGEIFKVEKLRGRWPEKNLSMPKNLWEGTYALPVPNNTSSIPFVNPSKRTKSINLETKVDPNVKTKKSFFLVTLPFNFLLYTS